MQKSLLKLLRVGAYWKRKESGVVSSFQELKLLTAFIRWKNQARATRPQTIYDSQAPVHESVRQRQEEGDSVKQTLDWLYSFDKK